MGERKPRHGLFALLAVLILLTGAAAASLAAWAVVTPRTGETQSAGVLTVPSVLGQTADEVLFYPWSMYGTEEHVNLLELAGLTDWAELDPELFSPELYAVSLLGVVDADRESAIKGIECTTETAAHLYLHALPCHLSDGTAVTLNWAMSVSDPCTLSLLLSPAEPAKLSRPQQDAALERVKEDLKQYLCGYDPEGGISDQLDRLAAISELRSDHRYASYTSPLQTLSLYRDEWCWFISAEASECKLEELTAELEEVFGLSVQLIVTPSQIVTLFSFSGSIIGIFYDIQLEQYSGFGFSS